MDLTPKKKKNSGYAPDNNNINDNDIDKNTNTNTTNNDNVHSEKQFYKRTL